MISLEIVDIEALMAAPWSAASAASAVVPVPGGEGDESWPPLAAVSFPALSLWISSLASLSSFSAFVCFAFAARSCAAWPSAVRVLGGLTAVLPPGLPVHGSHFPPSLPLVPKRMQARVALWEQPRHCTDSAPFHLPAGSSERHGSSFEQGGHFHEHRPGVRLLLTVLKSSCEPAGISTQPPATTV